MHSIGFCTVPDHHAVILSCPPFPLSSGPKRRRLVAMFYVLAYVLVVLTGSSSFQTRQRASYCLRQLDRFGGIPAPIISYARQHPDAEIRARASAYHLWGEKWYFLKAH